MLSYLVRLADPNRHLLAVECRIPAVAENETVSLPSWIPGSYLLREYARHVTAIGVTSAQGRPLLTKVDNSSWQVSGAAGEVVITMQVYALDLSVRGAYLDGERGYLNGTCVFLRVHGRESEPVELTIVPPEDPRCADWRVGTAMAPRNVDGRGFGRYGASDYDELIDHPIEISNFAEVEFKAAGIAHRLLIAGRHSTDLERVATDLSQLCDEQQQFFGAPSPFDRYVFLATAVEKGYGGLEHRASSSLMFDPGDLPVVGEPGVPRDYQRFLSLCSHEYFHAWHVKQLKPAAFSPYRLNERNYTRQLWVFEGITSYYQDLMLLRAGLIGAEAYLNRLAQTLTRVYRTPGRAQQSLAESSFDAWDRLYKPEPNSPNATISYYTKGALVALALDLTVRSATGSTASLDRILTQLWTDYGRDRRGIAEGEFEAVAAAVAGIPLTEFFDQAVRGTDDLPLGPLLAAFGVNLEFRAALGPQDAGGSAPPPSGPAPLGLGIAYRDGGLGLELTTVLDGGPAERAGLSPGDLLIAIGRRRVDAASLSRRLARFEAGDSVPVAYFRRGELAETELTLAPAPLDTCVLRLAAEADPAALALRQAWLGG
jgi:predicted metalloprotease with PDZ domain